MCSSDLTSESRNRMKTLGRLFVQQQSISYHGYREIGLNVVAVCNNFHTSSKRAIEVAVIIIIIELYEVRKISPRTGCKIFTIYYYFQNISVVGQKAKELQDRVYHLMVVIVDIVTKYVRHLTCMV